jgi:hypothetical protein
MAGRKYGIVMAAKVPGSYHALSNDEQEVPGEAFEEVMRKFEGKIDFVRRYWTSAFTAEVTDIFVMECDDLMDAHEFNQEFTRRLAQKGDPDRFGENVKLWVGVNPDV